MRVAYPAMIDERDKGGTHLAAMAATEGMATDEKRPNPALVIRSACQSPRQRVGVREDPPLGETDKELVTRAERAKQRDQRRRLGRRTLKHMKNSSQQKAKAAASSSFLLGKL